MATVALPSAPSFLTRKIALGITPAHILVVGIMLLSLILHLSNLDAIGDGNTYYTAAVKSMLQSWHNFFFVAAEPSGSVTVDKPPLGLWIEAAFAFVLGVEGWTVSLPNILAGVFSVPLLYHLVKMYMGAVAGLVAALVLVVTPVAIATDRNNTMDGMLVFTLLLAAWAFIAATETGKAGWLFLGAFIVGLGFNIKMLQAFLPLPAFYALYFFGSKTRWFRKVFNLGVATAILVMVSLSWAVAVDLTPADQRPYIGSSENNTVMELIVGHNGLSRIFGSGGNRGQGGAAPARQIPGNNPDGSNFQPPVQGFRPQNPPNGQPLSGVHQGTPASALGDGPNASPDGPPDGGNNGGMPFSRETGSPGLARFFVAPLSKQMSWLLPFALVGVVLVAFAARVCLPLASEHKALMLWGGWLLTCLVFFSAVEGIFHAYYAIMLAPALGAVVGGGFGQLWWWPPAGMIQVHRRWVDALLVVAAIITVAFQIFTAAQYGEMPAWIYIPVVLLMVAAGFFLLPSLRRVGYVTVLAALLTVPLIWTALTVFDAAPEVNLPTAFDGAQQTAPRPVPKLNEPNTADEDLLAFLQANTRDTEYMLAVPSSQVGSPLVLATGRPVLYMGGFNGGDPVIDAAGLAELVARGELRYVLYGAGRNDKQDIGNWLATSCTVVPEFSRENGRPAQGQQRPGNNQPIVLYQCG
ncbi:MAG: glycosyltransferase family 39 protein [Anaerolineales bacterium]|nr:glycosyltransferase family 39 protein [Anaerolineales bacterium]